MDKQIEEMAREIAKRDCYLYEHCPKQPKHNCVSQDPEIMLESSKKYITIAIWLVNAGYRKIPEGGAVVLTREEYETICFNLDESQRQGRKINDVYGQCLMAYNLTKDENEKLKTKLKKARKETAEKFKALLEGTVPQGLLDEIAKEITEGSNGEG